MTTSPEAAAPRLALSMREAAAALSLSERTFRDHVRRGSIRTCRLGGRRVVPVVELERWLERCREQAE
jgi:excisionase family DNA binding protein